MHANRQIEALFVFCKTFFLSVNISLLDLNIRVANITQLLVISKFEFV